MSTAPIPSDQSVQDWKRVRSGIEFENTLVNHRQTWHAGLQLPLIAAYFLVFSDAIKATHRVTGAPTDALMAADKNHRFPPSVQFALVVLPFLAILLSSFTQNHISAAYRQINELVDWWLTHYSHGSQTDYLKEHPPISRIFDQRIHRSVSPEYLPFLFAMAWGIALAMSLGQIAADHYDWVKENLLFISLVLALVIALVIIVFQEFGFRVFRRKKSATTTTP